MRKALNFTFTGSRLMVQLNSFQERILITFLKLRLNLISMWVQNISSVRNFLTNSPVIPYKSLDEITAVDFHTIKYQNKIQVMDKNYKSGKIYTNKDLVKLNYAWLKLVDDYFNLIKDQRGKTQFRKKTQQTALELNIQFMEQIIKTLSYCELNKLFLPLNAYNEFIKQTSLSLKKISSGLQKDGDVYEWIQKLINYNDGLKTKYSLKDKKEEIEAEFSDFYKELAYLEMALEKDNIPENIKMTKWIVYKNQVHSKIQKHG